ncbi:MAG: fibronectin type III domain-containing protein [Terriglobia bacterium]
MTGTIFAQSPALSVGTASGNPGTSVDLTVSFTAGSTGVSTLQFDLTFPSSLSYVSTATGAAASAAGKSASGSSISGGARVLVFALGTTSIGSGAVAIVRLNIASGTNPAAIPVGITGIVAADASSNSVPTSGTGGSVTVSSMGDTTAPTISGVTIAGISATGATISWTTNEASDTQVEYGTTTAYGSTTTLNTGMVTAHSQGLSGLTASTTYNYRVRSKDAAGNQAFSGNFSFKTTAGSDTTAPSITGIQVSSITTSTAQIGWTTDESSDTQVEYGPTTSYGSSTPLVTTLVANHLQILGNLTAGTVYHYRVKSKDASGNLAVSTDFTFTTSAILSAPTNVTVK